MRGEDLVGLNRHATSTTCPKCKENLNTVGIPSLVYTFEVCSCDVLTFDHLVEQLWHADCFRNWKPGDEGPAWDCLHRIVQTKLSGKGAVTTLRGMARATINHRTLIQGADMEANPAVPNVQSGRKAGR